MIFLIDRLKHTIKRFADDLPRDLIRRGSALMLVLVFMTFMLILGTGLLTVGQYMVVQSRTIGQADKYYYAAESAAQLAAQLLLREVSTKGADGTTSGVLAAKPASVGIDDDMDLVIQEMAKDLVASLANIYQDNVIRIVGNYSSGTGSPGHFNGLPATLGPLRVSTQGVEPIEISGGIPPEDIQKLFDSGVIAVEGNGPEDLFTPETYSSSGVVPDPAAAYYPAVAVYFTNPNFILTARSGGREVEVNTNVRFEFNIITSTSGTATHGAAAFKMATVSDVEIYGPLEGEVDSEEFTVTISGDELVAFQDANRILDEYLASGGIVEDVPAPVKIEGDFLNKNTLKFSVSPASGQNADPILRQPKRGPLRLTLPGELFVSGNPINVIRNDEAFWAIGGRVGNVLDGILSRERGNINLNDPGFMDYVLSTIVNPRITEADARRGNQSYYIPNNIYAHNDFRIYHSGLLPADRRYVEGSLTLGEEGKITVYPNLEYIRFHSLEIKGTVYCPKLIGAYGPTASVNFSPGSSLNPIYNSNGTKIATTGTPLIPWDTIDWLNVDMNTVDWSTIDWGFDKRDPIRMATGFMTILCNPKDGAPTQINWCEIDARELEINYSNQGRFLSNSAFYTAFTSAGGHVHFIGTPDTSDEGLRGAMPQFYFEVNSADVVNVFNIDNATALVGCFFIEDGGRLMQHQSPNLTKIYGVLVGNFSRPNHAPPYYDHPYPANIFKPVTMTDWNSTIWDEELRKTFAESNLSTATAYIDGAPLIEGTVGEPLSAPVTFHVTVDRGDTINLDKAAEFFADNDARMLFWNVPEGLAITCEATNPMTLKFEVSGTPTTPLTELIDIVIPAAIMTKGRAVNVDINEDAQWDIKGLLLNEPPAVSIGASLIGRGASLHDKTGED